MTHHPNTWQHRTDRTGTVPGRRTSPLPPTLSPRRPAPGAAQRRSSGRSRRALTVLLGALLVAGLGGWGLDRHLADSGVITSAVRAAGTDAGGTISVAVVARDGSTVAESSDAGSPFYTASLVKLLVVEQLLDGAADDGPPLGPGDRADLERAVTWSDDEAMNRLWVRFDGAGLVRAAVEQFGLRDTRPPVERGQWGQATTSAADMARFLTALPDHLPENGLSALTGWMRAASAQGADGFDQVFGLRTAAVGAPGATAVKQGWMCCVDGRRQLHSAGVLADGTAVVLLGEFPEEVPWDTARAALDTAAAGVVAGLADPRS